MVKSGLVPSKEKYVQTDPLIKDVSKFISFEFIHLFDSPNILSIMTCSKVEMYPKNEKPIKSPKEPPNDPKRLISSKIRISSNISTSVDANIKLNWTFMSSVPLSRSSFTISKSNCSTLVVYCLKFF